MSSYEFEAPVRKALCTPLLIGGVPREVARMNGILALGFLSALHSFWVIPIAALVHIVSVRLSKDDPEFIEVIKRNLKQKNFYD